MTKALNVILGVLNLLVLFLQSLRDARQREVGREEILNQQKEVDAKAAQRAAEVDALTRGSDIGELRDRMRDYQRPKSNP